MVRPFLSPDSGIHSEQVSKSGYSALRSKGIDALLSVKVVMAVDAVPESASARIISTHSRQIIVGLTWQNA